MIGRIAGLCAHVLLLSRGKAAERPHGEAVPHSLGIQLGLATKRVGEAGSAQGAQPVIAAAPLCVYA